MQNEMTPTIAISAMSCLSLQFPKGHEKKASRAKRKQANCSDFLYMQIYRMEKNKTRNTSEV